MRFRFFFDSVSGKAFGFKRSASVLGVIYVRHGRQMAFAKRPPQKQGHGLLPGIRMVAAFADFAIGEIVVWPVPLSAEDCHEIEGIVYGVDDAIVVAVGGLIAGTCLEPKF